MHVNKFRAVDLHNLKQTPRARDYEVAVHVTLAWRRVATYGLPEYGYIRTSTNGYRVYLQPTLLYMQYPASDKMSKVQERIPIEHLLNMSWDKRLRDWKVRNHT